MSNYVHQKGFIYPIEDVLPNIDEKATILLDQDKFVLANLGKNRYLVWLVYSSCGVQRRPFGHCRQCASKEIESFAPLFRNVLGDIDTTKLKYIDYCYCDTRDCIIDYYEDEQMTLDSAIAIAREGAKNKYDAARNDCQQLAGWLQELAEFKDTTPITDGWLRDNGFSEAGWMKVGDNVIRCYETGRARWFASVDNDERNFHEAFGRLKTLGQLKMFLALCGMLDDKLKDFVKWQITQ